MEANSTGDQGSCRAVASSDDDNDDDDLAHSNVYIWTFLIHYAQLCVTLCV